MNPQKYSKKPFLTKWNTTPDKGETNSGEIITEKAGYIPPKQQIQSMILAGQRLNEYRKELYDTMDPTEDIDIDPTRDKAFDLADATQMQNEVNESLQQQAEEAKKAEEEKKAGDIEKNEEEKSSKKEEKAAASPTKEELKTPESGEKSD